MLYATLIFNKPKEERQIDSNSDYQNYFSALRDYQDVSALEVIIRSLDKPKFKDLIIEMLDSNELYYYVLQVHYNPNINFEFPKNIIDEIISFIDEIALKDHYEYIDSSETMRGADPAAYPPDGTWCATLYEFFDHYIWVEPEGQEYGFFSDLKSAKSFGAINYTS